MSWSTSITVVSFTYFNCRLPWHPELEEISAQQKRDRDEKKIQFWLADDPWDENDIRIGPTDKGRKKKIPTDKTKRSTQPKRGRKGLKPSKS